MAMFDLNDDPTDQAAADLAIELNGTSAVLDASPEQDADGTYVEVWLDRRYDKVPEPVAKRVYGAEFAIADVSPKGPPDSYYLIVEVRP